MPRILIILAAIVVAAAAVWPAWSRASAAADSLISEQARLDAALRLESQLAELRLRLPMPVAPTSGDSAALVQAAVREVGLPAQTVAEVSPQDSTTVFPSEVYGNAAPAAKWRRHAVQVRLNALPLADIGALLHELRSTAAGWTISQLELRAEPRRPSGDTDTETALYALSCRLTRTTLERAEP